MLNEDLKQVIIDKQIVNNQVYDARKARFRFTIEEKAALFDLTPNCHGKTMSERVYWLINNLVDYPKSCLECGRKITAWKDWNQTYSHDFCSQACQGKSPITKKKIKDSLIEKYGTDNPNLIPERVRKSKETNQKKYGVDNIFQSKIMQDYMRLKFYEKYNADCPLNNPILRQQIQETNIEKYGGVSPLSSPEIQSKYKKTNLEKYGSTNASKNKNIVEKIRSLAFARTMETYPILNDPKKLKDMIEKTSIKQASQIIGCDQSTIYNFLDLYGIEYNKKQSYLEEYMSNFLNQHNIQFSKNNRAIISPLELDFYIPDYNLAIELNGIYWHSELNGINKKYHINKTLLCQEQDIQLLHIFENEIFYKKEIVESRINTKLGTNDKIYARKCKIQKIYGTDKKAFFEKCHIQSDASSLVSYGLCYNNNLVACMSFGKPRFNKNCGWELLRFASELNTNIVGGASKLFKHFIKEHNPSSIITYADRRWGEGLFYNLLGFSFSHTSKPNYFYFKGSDLTLHSRNKFQKHKLEKELKVFDSGLTEWENMQINGWNRIWDCGNNVYIWSNHS